MLKNNDTNQLILYSAYLRGDQPAFDRQTRRGRCTSSPAEGIRRTPRLAIGASRPPVRR